MRRIIPLACMILLGMMNGAAHAIPALQLYIEGGVYNKSTDTWEFDPQTSADSFVIRLWAIGNVAGPGGKGPINDVKLAIAYAAGFEPNTPVPYRLGFNLAPSTTGGYGGITDPSTPGIEPDQIQRNTDGDTPLMTGGKPLPSHGVYGDGVFWREFALGDFTLTDSTIGDFIDGFPTTLFASGGQINVYEIRVATNNPATLVEPIPVQLHFDLYDSIASKTKGSVGIFQPFSHDGLGGISTSYSPEPSSLALALIGALGCGVAARRKRRAARVPDGSTVDGE